MLEVADIVRRVGPSFRRAHAGRLRREQRRALHDIEVCRTPALGGQVRRCNVCGVTQYSYHSCRNRHCPKCHGEQTRRWLDAHRLRFLPCRYFLLTFTLPAELRPLARTEPRAVYNALLTASAAALQSLVADPRYLGARPRMLAVLHTWTRRLTFHPHVHMLVTAGGLAADGHSWIAPRHDTFLVPARPLAIVFRAKLRDALRQRELLARAPRAVWNRPWVVHAQHAGSGDKVLQYLARYVFRVAIANSRLVTFDDGRVTFRYRDGRTHRLSDCTVSADLFLQRLLQHVLPPRFAKVRHYGLFSTRATAARDQARLLLAPPSTTPTDPPSSPIYGPALDRCPLCHVGRLLLVEILPPTRSPP